MCVCVCVCDLCVCVRVRVCSERLKTEGIFTNIEMNNKWNVNFLQNSPLGIQCTYSSEFSTVQSNSEIQVSSAFISYKSWETSLLTHAHKMKHSFFQAAVVSILLYGCTTWMLTKRLEKKLDSNYTRMLRAILNNSWRQNPTKQQLYGHLPPITKTIKVRRTRYTGHCRRSRDELISDVLLWTPSYDRIKAGQPARTYIQQLCEDSGCNPEGLPEAMNDREE